MPTSMASLRLPLAGVLHPRSAKTNIGPECVTCCLGFRLSGVSCRDGALQRDCPGARPLYGRETSAGRGSKGAAPPPSGRSFAEAAALGRMVGLVRHLANADQPPYRAYLTRCSK